MLRPCSFSTRNKTVISSYYLSSMRIRVAGNSDQFMMYVAKWTLAAVLVCIMPQSSAARNLTLQGTAWLANEEPDGANRDSQDLLFGTGAFRFYDDPIPAASVPLSVAIELPREGGDVYLAFELDRSVLDTGYNGIATNTVFQGQFTNYTSTNAALKFGFTIQEGDIQIRPGLTRRTFRESFKLEERSFYTGGFSILQSSDWYSRGGNLGFFLNAAYSLNEIWTLNLAIEQSILVTSGVHRHSRDDFAFLDTSLTSGIGYVRTDGTSNYEVQFRRLKLGAAYKIDESLHIDFGLLSDTREISYPGYFDFSIAAVGVATFSGGAVAAAAGTTVDEYITDLLVYEQEKSATKVGFYTGITYNTDF